MNAAQIEKMKALALAAENGEWLNALHDRAVKFGQAAGTFFMPNKEVARFVAAANPAAVLELIADNERLRADAKIMAKELAERASALRAEPAVIDLPALPQPWRKEYERPHGLQTLLYYTALDMEEYGKVCANAATRCRAEGGGTSEKSGLLDDSKTAETRMDTGFEGGHLGTAPVAGTEKDAERYRWLRAADWGDIESLFWDPAVQNAGDPDACMIELDKAIDAAIGAHTKVGAPG